MKTTKPAKPARINIKISMKAYKKLSKLAKQEGRTLLAFIDYTLAV